MVACPWHVSGSLFSIDALGKLLLSFFGTLQILHPNNFHWPRTRLNDYINCGKLYMHEASTMTGRIEKSQVQKCHASWSKPSLLLSLFLLQFALVTITIMATFRSLAYLVPTLLVSSATAATKNVPGKSSFVAPPGFPTSVFSSYWEKPVATQEPQPALYDPILNETYPLNLTNPDTIPDNDPDPIYYPQPIANLSSSAKEAVVASLVSQIEDIINDNYITGNCSKCLAGLSVAKSAALLAPELVPDTMVSLCKQYQLHSNSTCEEDFQATTFGAIWTQILALADVAGLDGQYICSSAISGSCSTPKTSPLNTTSLFPKPKPANATAPRASGKRVKVLHLR